MWKRNESFRFAISLVQKKVHAANEREKRTAVRYMENKQQQYSISENVNRTRHINTKHTAKKVAYREKTYNNKRIIPQKTLAKLNPHQIKKQNM